ncbi:DUF417 family protein [soil metagenome]|jgi:uncharacterized membrane protein YkgB
MATIRTEREDLAATGTAGTLERSGELVLRYGLVIILLAVGALKFTMYEAEALRPLVSNSPLLSWGYDVFGVQGFAMVLGVIEIVLALMIATRSFAPKLSAWGSIGAIIMFLTTLTLVFTTPAAWQQGYGFPFPSPMPGQFLLKDVLLLGAALWTAGEALAASKRREIAH